MGVFMNITFYSHVLHRDITYPIHTGREGLIALLMSEYKKLFSRRRFSERWEARWMAAFRADTTGYYHAVRSLIESLNTTNFDEVVSRFCELYPAAHEDWQSALKTGLVVKSERRIDNYFNTPLIFPDHPLAEAIRVAGLNELKPILTQILN